MIVRTLLNLLAIIGIGIAISACSTYQTKGPTYPVVGTVDQASLEQAAFAARSTYAGLLHWAAVYANLPRCSSVQKMPCSEQSSVNVLRKYDTAADTATKAAAEIARNPSKSSIPLANAVADAQRAVAAFRATVEVLNPSAPAGK